MILRQHAQGEPCLTVLVTTGPEAQGQSQCVPSLPQTEHSWGNPREPSGEDTIAPTLTKTAKKRSVLSSCTLLEAIFLSLQCSACRWMASFSILMGELIPRKEMSDDRFTLSCSSDTPQQPDAQLPPCALRTSTCQGAAWWDADPKHSRQEPRSPTCMGLTAPTERCGEQPVHNDVCVAADGRSEVRVEGHIEGVVAEEGLVLQDAGAEVQSHLKSSDKQGEGVRKEGSAGP